MTEQPQEEIRSIPSGEMLSATSSADEEAIPSLSVATPYPSFEIPSFEPPIRQPGEEPPAGTKRRGRPPGSKNRPKDGSTVLGRVSGVVSALPQYESKEVQIRIKGMLQGGSGIAGVYRPYFKMTNEEADAISKPLSTYLVRRAPESQAVQNFLEHYDIAAFVLATLAYAIRVIRDDAEYRKSHAKPRALPARKQRDDTPPNNGPGEPEREVADGGFDPTGGGVFNGISSPVVPG
jgi:hypothetical protein